MSQRPSLLWEIQAPNHTAPSYVFGTMHVKDRKAFRYYDLVTEKIERCEAFATEIDFSTVDPLAMRRVMRLPEGQWLTDLIRPKLYQKIRGVFLKAAGLDLHDFRANRPIMFNNLLAQQILAGDMPYSLDEDLWQFAQSRDKILFGVESFASQLELMENIPLTEQVRALIWTGRHFSRFRQQLIRTVNWYEQGDLRQLHRSAKKSLHRWRKPLLYHRNERMATQIYHFAEQQPILAAIGAGHLAGGKGVLRLLKRAGLKVKPVNIKS